MDETLMAHLPENIAAEARSLQQERNEQSRQQLMAIHQARYETQQLMDIPRWSHTISPHNIPSIRMLPGSHYHAYSLPSDRSDRMRIYPSMTIQHPHPIYMQRNSGNDLTGKQILDQEGLACLLVLLFLDQSKIHFNRLFRIFRNLSQHIPSRSWLISSLLSILKKNDVHTCPHPGQYTTMANQSHWLNMTINAALGSHVSVFQFPPTGGKQVSNDVQIHQHASVSICGNVLDLLVFLARQFSISFLPPELMHKDKQPSEQTEPLNNFWQILLKLDLSQRKGKSLVKASPHPDTSSSLSESNIFSVAPIGLLMKLFDHPILQGSVILVDKLLRVLSVISGAIPKQGLSKTKSDDGTSKETEETATKAMEGVSDVANVTDKRAMVTITESPLEDGSAQLPTCYSSSVVSVGLLNSVISLVTSGKCTEDCLDDATNLLINLSRCSSATREAILFVLLEGVQKIGRVLSNQISVLLSELTHKMASISLLSRQSSNEGGSSACNNNTVPPSLGTTEGVILPTLQGRSLVTDHSQDLHLSCMEPLVCKGSQQSFFLRLLKVVCQLRESSQSILILGARRSEPSSVSSFLLPQSLLLSSNRDAMTPPNQTVQTPSQEGDVPPTTSGQNAPVKKPDPTREEPIQDPSPYMTSLSLQLELEELWVSLSDCLDGLANTYDPHAVLVLQSTVEAFFLVHADQSEEVRSSITEKRSGGRARRLPSFHTISDSESNIGSPAPYDTFSPTPFTPVLGEGEASDPYLTLAPDMARFLKFAGN